MRTAASKIKRYKPGWAVSDRILHQQFAGEYVPDVMDPQSTVNDSPTVIAQQKQAEVIQSKTNTTGLPDNLKSGIENLSGLSLDDVRVHYNSSKPARRQALAYTRRTDRDDTGLSLNDHLALEQEASAMVRQALQATFLTRPTLDQNDEDQTQTTVQRQLVI